jgi:hypothetical protein
MYKGYSNVSTLDFLEPKEGLAESNKDSGYKKGVDERERFYCINSLSSQT